MARVTAPAVAINPVEATVFRHGMAALRREGIPFLIAGAYAVERYSGHARHTKDLDVLVLPRDQDAAIAALGAEGFQDYFTVDPYDRRWIYRAHDASTIFDVIWAFANQLERVTPEWFARARTGEFLGETVQFAAPEDLIWMKLFVLQRTRRDWPDIVNIVRGTRGRLDWRRLIRNLGEHCALLGGAIHLYDWLCPAERDFIPDFARQAAEAAIAPAQPCRAALLDSRPWLAEAGVARL